MVVTRFAPSPTGSLHVGGLRTAIFNYAYAKKHGGKFILRIEDTDEVRSTDDSLRGIVRDLKWAGIEWDEGPSFDPEDLRNNQRGHNGPYFQSQRKDIYNKEIDRLLQENKAYEKDGAIMFRMPVKPVTIKDEILGDVTYPASECKDMVIRKASGMPTFHFAVVVDDHVMGVTHVIRGQEHLQNTWKHILLAEELGYKNPTYAHIPLILNVDGSKMSKRQKTGQVNTNEFKKDGYVPEAMIRYLVTLGWTVPTDLVDTLTLEDICEHFDIHDIGKANGRFDYKKLQNVNAKELQGLHRDAFGAKVSSFLEEYRPDFMDKWEDADFSWFSLTDLYQSRANTLADIPTMAHFFVERPTTYDTSDVEKHLKSKNNLGLTILANILVDLKNLAEWTASEITNKLESYKIQGYTMNQIAQPLRVAIAGKAVTPPIGETLVLLGKEETLLRIRICLEQHMMILV
jgi:glutamyl/glutaminyl-tRNA synthetase